MPESVEHLKQRLDDATQSGFRERLLDKGLARGVIWSDGHLPLGSPAFPESLTEELLNYAHTVLYMALRLREKGEKEGLERPFLVAGEAIEAAIHRGANSTDSGFHRVSAAVAFHLARYSARSYSMLPAMPEVKNLAPTESALVQLMRRKLDGLHNHYISWLLNPRHDDKWLANNLQKDEKFGEVDACSNILTSSFMRGLALFDHAITTGETSSACLAQKQLKLTADSACDLNAVSHWWTATLAYHLVDELWELSLYQRLPLLSPEDDNAVRWGELRLSYVQRLRARERATIELWPSQLEAGRRALDPIDDLVVALPTSAGKTRIAEICILRALASNRRVVYVTPLRALSAQVERDLAETFAPLGFSVSSLYGSAGLVSGDAQTLRQGKIVVATPEKLDFALRNDVSIINDVGLVVLDEGHMFGPNEREVRYEALVQSLLRRGDARDRRIICLSALFPGPEEMSDLVAWIRQDDPGGPIHSIWRPTRQRFGLIRWMSNAARLEISAGEESPFVPRFIEISKPPKSSRRRTKFPKNKNELTLATGWRFIEQKKDVLIYCALRKSVETLGRLVLKCIEQKVLKPLDQPKGNIQSVMAIGIEWLGEDHPAVQCLQHGVVLHHGGLPRPYLSEVERLLRSGGCHLIIASPTLAQGLNLSASILLVPSIWRNKKVIPTEEFANVAGRAGRAFIDIEGLILHVVWERPNKAERDWKNLIEQAKAPLVISGILWLSVIIYKRISSSVGIPFEELVEYVTGNSSAWDFNVNAEEKLDVSSINWDRDIASLDAALLALLDAGTDERNLAKVLADALSGSLFDRQMARYEEDLQNLMRGFIAARAAHIWEQTTEPRRRGYHAAGIGLTTGQFLDDNLQNLVKLLGNAELGISDGNLDDAISSVTKFAEIAFQTVPFYVSKNKLPDRWKDALQAWMQGRPAAEVIDICNKNGVDFLQDVLVYRLPWAMEAVRVHAIAVSHELAECATGVAARSVESGSCDESVIVLLRAGLNSREAAFAAVRSTEASFDNLDGLRAWLDSNKVKTLHASKSWPTVQSRHAWVQFYKGKKKDKQKQWKRETQVLPVKWGKKKPKAGSHVVIVHRNKEGIIMSPEFTRLGKFTTALKRPSQDIVSAQVGGKLKTVVVEYFGLNNTW